MLLLSAEGAAGGKSAYIRYVVPTPDDEEATVEYDLDEEDEEWLQQHNSQVCFLHLESGFCNFHFTFGHNDTMHHYSSKCVNKR